LYSEALRVLRVLCGKEYAIDALAPRGKSLSEKVARTGDE